MNLVSSQCGVAVRLDPHPGHGVVEDLIVLDEAQTCYCIYNSRIRLQVHILLSQTEWQCEKYKPEL